jgi:hypothetical protein
MNNKWADVKRKQQEFMEKWIMEIKKKYCTTALMKALPKDKTKDTMEQKERRETCNAYTAMVRAWKDAQMPPFSTPWSAAV